MQDIKQLKEECKCELDGFLGAITPQNCKIHSPNQESTSNWEELYTKAFSYRFSNIAKQADKGQDFLYGKD